ncbi:hypothetical protein N7452_001384 [Penicillium brevicompactum]|uniref:Uncharacterized protein n=1 Tax=Penicillium brevicompactum TaxID=5074 RepID=A0A9W9R3T9_PENBR|nr:hypothetical protein N7452_001384 [Penicillium brevicompactum]
MAFLPSFEPYVLTELDHTLVPVHVSILLAFHVEKPIDSIPVLEAAVARLVYLLPFLGGNVTSSNKIVGKKNVLEVQPPSKSFWSQHPMLVVKKHDLSMAPGGSSPAVLYDDIPNETFLPIRFQFTGVDPVCRFQANLMRDGVILTLSIHHQALDGIGGVGIIDALSKCCRNPNTDAGSLSTSSEKESKSRAAISGVASTSQAAGVPDHSNSVAVAGHSLDFDELNQNAHNPVCRKLVFNGEKIKQLRKMCAEQALSSDQGVSMSGNTIVTAVLWICWIRARFGPHALGPQAPDTTSAALLSNIRSQMSPNLPTTYMGNALGLAWSNVSAEHVLSSFSDLNYDSRAVAYMDPQYVGIVADAAKKLHYAVQGISDRSVRDIISEKNEADDWASQYTLADIHVSSLRHFPFYALDFGSILGKPCDVDMPENRFPGMVWIMPSRGNPLFSPWEVRLTLQPELMEIIRKDPLLRWLSSDVRPRL